MSDEAAMQQWEYLTTYISGALDFPDSVGRDETFDWAGKAISQQINAIAVQGWELIDLRWLTDLELMVTFKRPVRSGHAPDEDSAV